MDRIDFTPVNGFPLDQNDLEWVQNGIAKALKGISDAFGTGYVLSGCQVTDLGGFSYTIAPGYVVMNGEVYEFEGVVSASYPGGIAAYKFIPQLTDAPGQSEVFEDLSNINVYKRRRATIGLLATPGDSAPIGETLTNRIKGMLAYEVAEPWHIIGEAGEPNLGNDYAQGTGNLRVMFRKEPGGVVRLRGQLLCASVGGTNLVAFTLPVGYRPHQVVSAALPRPSLTSPVDGSTRSVYITPAGEVVVFLLGGAVATDRVALDGFPTFVAA